MARGTILTTVTKDGTKRYKTIIRINGKQQWRTWNRKREAENYLDDLSPEVRDQTYREIKKATFGEYLKIWKQVNLNDKMLKPSTIPSYASVIEHHLLPAFKGFPMQAITPDEINLFRTKLLKNGLSGKTVNNILNLLGKILTNAKKDHYLKFSPMPDVDKAQTNKEQKGRALKPDEIQSILHSLEGVDRVAIAAAIATGMRRGEQFGLDWENVDFENNIIRIRRALYWKLGKYHEHREGEPKYTFVTPKSKKSIRDIDMSPELRKELIELYLKSGKKGLVFPSGADTPMNPDNFVKGISGEFSRKPKRSARKTNCRPLVKSAGMIYGTPLEVSRSIRAKTCFMFRGRWGTAQFRLRRTSARIRSGPADPRRPQKQIR